MLIWQDVRAHAVDWKPLEDGVFGMPCPVCGSSELMVVSERSDGTAHCLCPKGCSPVKIERLLGRFMRPGANGHSPNGGEPHRPQIFKATDLMVKVFPPMLWAVPNMIGEGLTILAGGTKAGKSYMSLAAAVAVANGGKVFGKLPVEMGSVLYLALEDSERRLQDRLDDILQGEAVPPGLELATEWPMIGAGCEEALVEWIETHDDARLIVVDVFQKIRPPRGKNTEPYDDDYRVTSALHKIALPNQIALLALHHTRKMAAEDPFDMISGSAGMTGAADGMMVLMRQRDQKEAVLHFIGRDIGSEAWAMEWDEDIRTWNLLGDAQKHVMSSQRVAILRLLEETQEDLSPMDVSSMLSMPHGNVKRLLIKMAGELQVVKSARGRYRAVRKIEEKGRWSDTQ